MKIILTEKQLKLIQKNLMNEIGLDGQGEQYIAGGVKSQAFKKAIKEGINNVGGNLVKAAFPKTPREIANFQNFAKSKGFKNVSGKNIGKLIVSDGKWGPNTDAAWKKLSSSYYVPEIKTNTSKTNTSKTSNISWLKSTSKQVKQQINYLINQGFSRPFTIVDDINSKVYAVNEDFSLHGVYNVITGRDRGDEVKDVTFYDWYMEHPLDNTWKFLKDIFNSDLNSAVKNLDSQYFNTQMWVKKNTPSGLFFADKSPGNWLESKVMTAFAEKTYGKRFIGFKKPDGKSLAVGFHGTKNPERININSDDWTRAVKSRKGNFSFGCINFKDTDIQNISDFINNGQPSFWLPDSSSGIVELPREENAWSNMFRNLTV